MKVIAFHIIIYYITTGIPKIHVELEIYDDKSLRYFNVSIPEIEEFQEENKLSCKVFLYVVKVFRNDGLEWIVKKRYSEIRALRQALAENISSVRILIKEKNLFYKGDIGIEFSFEIFVEIYKQAFLVTG